jgi:Methyltransferase small domain
LLREALARADYSADGLARILGGGPQDAREHDDALETLVKLFYLNTAVDPSALEAALAPLPPVRLEAMEVLDGRQAALEIAPVGGVLVASDLERETHRLDRVPGPSKASRSVAAVTLRNPGRALDMGTGSGVQALLLAGHAHQVVATDVNERALEFARFNAALNEVSIDLRRGSLFEPVAGEHFDLIVSNPPYVISPDTGLLFRDGGLPGDSFSEAVVRQAPGLLVEGGFAQIRANWVVPGGEPPEASPLRWLRGTGCDALVLHTRTWNTFDYATSWNTSLRDDAVAFGEAFERWLAYFRAEGIERIGGGVLVLRRRSAPDNWVLPLSTQEPQPGAAGQVRRLFAAQDHLRSHDDESLLAQSFAATEDHTVELSLRSGSVVAAHAASSGGLGIRVALDERTADLLARIEPGRTLRELGGDDAAAIVRRLLGVGLVEPA